MNSEAVIAMESLWKRFTTVNALCDINLSIMPGQIVGLLGSNGSGKSTLLKHVMGLYLPTKGHSQTFGVDGAGLTEEILSKLGYVAQENDLIPWMRGEQFLRFISVFYPTWDLDLEKRLAKEFNLDLFQRIGTMSTGQRQLLAIVAAVSYRPQLLILDEPAASLDPLVRIRFLDLLLQLIQDEGRTIVISSHILSDVEKVIDHAVIMDAGQILRDVSLDELRSEFIRIKVRALSGELSIDWQKLNGRPEQQGRDQAAGIIAQAEFGTFKQIAAQSGWSLESTPLSLEESYAHLMTRGGRI